MVRRDGALNFLATETLHLFNGKSEGLKPKNTVPTVNQGGGSLVFWAVSRPMYAKTLRRLMTPWNNSSSYMKNLHETLKQYAKALNLGLNMTFPKNIDPKHSAKSEENCLWTTM